jgi:biopolymer transport protein ExbD
MAFGGFDQQGAGRSKAAPMSDINMTPLIDVMLVLLVIFIITAPLLTHAIRLDLPRVAAASSPETRRTVTVTVDAAGKLYWNDKAISLADLRARMADEGRSPEPAELHLRADQASRYQMIAAVMSAAQQAGLSRIGFVTEPPSTTAAAQKVTPPH